MDCSFETFTIDIDGYQGGLGGYYLIASPIQEDVTPSEGNGFITDDFDLYYFDEGQASEWINYDQGNGNIGFEALVSGKGYLYASNDSTTLIFRGTPYNGNGEVILRKTENADWSGWNLVGNPFAETAYLNDGRQFYTMRADGAEIILAAIPTIEAMEGIFVVAESDEEILTFTTEEFVKGSMVILNLSNNQGVIDRAMVRFDACRQLPKFQLNDNSTKLYITMDNEDYAVVRSEEVGEMPVNFKAEENGTYTLNISADNIELGYLHLIDNMTGDDIDLLATPSYSFAARTTDNVNHFKLVYATGILSVSEDFAFFSNGSFVINNEGNATLQVIDINGRVISSETINGCANVNVDGAAGVYLIRLVNGENVKVQKVVVK